MIGLLLALLSGLSFAVSNVYIRTGMHRSGEAFSLIPIFACIGTIIFGVMSFAVGAFNDLGSLTWVGLTALSVAGIIHYILGRIFGYTGIRLIGANRAVPIFSSSLLIAALLGIFLMGEPLTLSIILAVVLILTGVILIGSTGNSSNSKITTSPENLLKGLIVALAAALCWGISPVLVKIGLREIGSPVAATFISYTASLLVISISLFNRANSRKLLRLKRNAIVPIIYAGIAVAAAQIFRYSALTQSPISAVEPILMSVNSLFIFPLSFLINREIEAFNLKIILGALAIVVGVFVIFLVA